MRKGQQQQQLTTTTTKKKFKLNGGCRREKNCVDMCANPVLVFFPKQSTESKKKTNFNCVFCSRSYAVVSFVDGDDNDVHCLLVCKAFVCKSCCYFVENFHGFCFLATHFVLLPMTSTILSLLIVCIHLCGSRCE